MHTGRTTGFSKTARPTQRARSGLAFSFDGVDDFVEIPDNNIYVSGSSFFTIEFWAKFNSVRQGTFTAPGTIFLGNSEGSGDHDKWYFGHTGNILYFHENTPAGLQQFIAAQLFIPATNTWYHLALVRTSGSTYKLYTNGVLAISEVNTNPIPNTIAPLTLGQAGGIGFMDGQLDEVTIYNYDLTAAEVLAIYNAGSDGKCRSCVPPPSGLVDWWPGNGNALDVQGTNSGTLIGGATFGNAGWVGEAFSFNGVDAAVTTTLNLPYNSFSNMTWECWVLPTRINYGRQQIMSIDDGGFDFSLLIQDNNFAVFTGNQSWVPPNQVVYPFEWQHLAVVFTPTNMEFYRNGIRYSLGSGAVYGGSNSRFNIGRNPVFGEYFQGMIDEVSIYNRALSELEIQQIYASANSGKCRSTVAGARIEASPVTLDFGLTTTGQTNERTLVVQNTGSTTLSNSLAFSNAVFSVGSPGASFTVPAGGSQVVKVCFVPTAATNSSGTLTITHNDPSRPPIVVALNGTGQAPAVCIPAPNGLVSWWRAEDYSGTDAWGTNHGLLANGVGIVPAKVGNGFSFTGASNYVDAPMGGIAVGGGDFTVEGWIKADPGNNTYTIISFGGVYNPTIYLNNTEGVLSMWPRDAAPAGTGFKDGQFHHFAVVREGNATNALKYYKDGVLIGATIASYDLVASRCRIGWDNSVGQAFLGIIDDLSFYNRALSAAELGAIVAAGSAGKCSDPLANPPHISVTPTNLDFATLIVGSSATLNLTVSNLGKTLLTVSTGAVDNARFSLSPGTLPFNVAPGAAQAIAVRFAPMNTGFQPAR